MIVLVPTYARPVLFARLVADLARELRPHDRVIVLDDASPEPYARRVLLDAEMCATHRVITADANEGKRGYWRTVNRLIDAAMDARTVVGHASVVAPVYPPPAEPVAYLADDLRLAKRWREEVLKWLAIAETYPGCIGLHAHRDGRTREWGLPGGEDIGPGERMAWQDGVWVTRVRWLDALRPSEVNRDWERSPHLGSGAWRSSSYRTHEAGLWWLRPKVRLCWHADDGQSVMNPFWSAGETRRKARRVYTEGDE